MELLCVVLLTAIPIPLRWIHLSLIVCCKCCTLCINSKITNIAILFGAQYLQDIYIVNRNIPSALFAASIMTDQFLANSQHILLFHASLL